MRFKAYKQAVILVLGFLGVSLLLFLIARSYQAIPLRRRLMPSESFFKNGKYVDAHTYGLSSTSARTGIWRSSMARMNNSVDDLYDSQITNVSLAPIGNSSNFSGVVIVTYMRSGSSLTGDILQQSPGAFYVYEPLHAIGNMVKKPAVPNLTFMNGTTRQWPFAFDEEAVNIIRNWLVCDIFKLPKNALMDGFLNKGIKSNRFRICYSKQVHLVRNSTVAMTLCAHELKSVCEKSPIRILKTIRTPLNWISHLLDELPGLQIIHLVRDPRATLKSQSRFGMCTAKRGGIGSCTNAFCKRQENDLLEVDRLTSKYPGRIIRVFYEDIAAKPIESSRILFDFIGTTFTPWAEEYIFNITLAGNPNNCPICTTRSNSSIHIDSWRTKIMPEFLNAIENRCNYILRRYNYSLMLTSR